MLGTRIRAQRPVTLNRLGLSGQDRLMQVDKTGTFSIKRGIMGSSEKGPNEKNWPPWIRNWLNWGSENRSGGKVYQSLRPGRTKNQQIRLSRVHPAQRYRTVGESGKAPLPSSEPVSGPADPGGKIETLRSGRNPGQTEKAEKIHRQKQRRKRRTRRKLTGTVNTKDE